MRGSRPLFLSMITGYNTDVSHRGQVLHVQTEDKGVGTAWIESLVYAGGQILARKRSSYKSLLDEGRGKDAISEFMDRQHRLVIAEIRKGRFDGKLETAADAHAATGGGSAAVVAEAAALAREAEAPLAPETESGPSLDQVILDYLNSEAEQEQLVLVMDAEEELAMGRTARLTLSAKSSVSNHPVVGADIAVRMISTVAEPTTLGSGKTDAAGDLQLTVSIPELQQGTAALIVIAASSIGAAEIKQLL